MSYWTDVAAVLNPDGTVKNPSIPAPPVVDPEAVRPNVSDVASSTPTRTVSSGGSEESTYTSSTRPTAAQVQSMVDAALVDVLAQLPPNIDTVWYPVVSRAIALRVAAMVEGSFYRENADVRGSASAFIAQFNADLASLQSLIPKAVYIG